MLVYNSPRMALTLIFKEITFGVGDKIKVIQKIKEGEKERTATFEGIVIGIKGEGENKMFTVRKLGAQNIGIERIFPLFSPFLEKIEVVKKGTPGVNSAKLYYVRTKSQKEIDEIYSRALRRTKNAPAKKKN